MYRPDIDITSNLVGIRYGEDQIDPGIIYVKDSESMVYTPGSTPNHGNVMNVDLSYAAGLLDGKQLVLTNLGIKSSDYDDLVRLKSEGSTVIISVKVLEPVDIEDFVDEKFLSGEEIVGGFISQENSYNVNPGDKITYTVTAGTSPYTVASGAFMGNPGFVFAVSDSEKSGPKEGTSAGYSPEGDALYTCSRCPGLHRRFEECPKPQYDTGDPWNHPSDGNPENA